MQPTATVILSTFPPLRCGIARYAAQHAACLRRRGNAVVTIGLPGSEADAVVDARGARKPLAVLDAARGLGVDPSTCGLAIHWHDEHYFAGGFTERLPTAFALARLIGAFAESEIICHETYPPQEVTHPVRRMLGAAYRSARRRAWLRSTRIAFHSEAERTKSEEAHGGRWPDSKVLIRGHSAFLFRYRDVTQTVARRELGVAPDAFLFLCIGFLAEHKGFHTAAAALTRVPGDTARLAIVGSAREEVPEARAYASRLRELAAQDPRVDFRETFVSDQEYDTWNAAADVVVAPYLVAFSSSVVARAKLFGKPVIVTDVGGLADQTGADDIVVGQADDLADAMSAVLARRACA
jgi:glycosyltransferase involved in cell wall biosynthesis